jgi:hypothetical protein
MPIWGAHIEMGINAHIRELQRGQGYLERETQRRPCSNAERVAAVRELTPSLW